MPTSKYIFYARERLLAMIEASIKADGEFKIDLSISELNTAIVRAVDSDTGQQVRFKIRVSREY